MTEPEFSLSNEELSAAIDACMKELIGKGNTLPRRQLIVAQLATLYAGQLRRQRARAAMMSVDESAE